MYCMSTNTYKEMCGLWGHNIIARGARRYHVCNYHLEVEVGQLHHAGLPQHSKWCWEKRGSETTYFNRETGEEFVVMELPLD